MTATVTVTGKKPEIDPDDVRLRLDGSLWGGWQSVHITRGLERMPSSFEVTLTEIAPDEVEALVARAGQPCEVLVGKDLVLTGYVDRYAPSIDPHGHSVRIVGRGKCADLVDCAAEWEGGQIRAASVLDVARKLATPYGIAVNGELGKGVGDGKSIIPQINLMLGETAWEIIERLCRISAIVPYELPNGSLYLSWNLGDPEELAKQRDRGRAVYASSGFVQGVNVKRASAEFAMDQRYSEVQAYLLAFDPLKDVGPQFPIHTATDAQVAALRHRRMVVIAESGKPYAIDYAKQRAEWEIARRMGRGHAVRLTTDAWRDSSGVLYAPAMLVKVDLPALKINDVEWMISEVTYRKGEQGTECDLVLMPPMAFAVQPTLPAYTLPADVALLPDDLGRKGK